jgi:hypothetical protein
MNRGAQDGVIGWHAADGGADLLPDLSRSAVEGVPGMEGLNRVSKSGCAIRYNIIS